MSPRLVTAAFTNATHTSDLARDRSAGTGIRHSSPWNVVGAATGRDLSRKRTRNPSDGYAPAGGQKCGRAFRRDGCSGEVPPFVKLTIEPDDPLMLPRLVAAAFTTATRTNTLAVLPSHRSAVAVFRGFLRTGPGVWTVLV
jgi:hypothetical protein